MCHVSRREAQALVAVRRIRKRGLLRQRWRASARADVARYLRARSFPKRRLGRRGRVQSARSRHSAKAARRTALACAMAWRATAAKGVHELRFALCQTSAASEGARRVPGPPALQA
jgi:hypothetical protein